MRLEENMDAKNVKTNYIKSYMLMRDHKLQTNMELNHIARAVCAALISEYIT